MFMPPLPFMSQESPQLHDHQQPYLSTGTYVLVASYSVATRRYVHGTVDHASSTHARVCLFCCSCSSDVAVRRQPPQSAQRGTGFNDVATRM